MVMRVVAVLLVLVLSVAGCGGDDNSDNTAAGSSTTTTTAAEAVPEDDLSKAKAVVLKRSDLPGVWTTEPSQEDEGAANSFRSCMGLDPAGADYPSADSPSFSTGYLRTVNSSATVAPTAAAIDTDFAAFNTPKMLDCAVQQAEMQLKEQSEVTFGPLRADRLDFPQLGGGSTALRIASSFTAEGQEVPVFIDVVAVKVGRIGMTLSLVNGPEPFPSDLAVQLTEKMVARARS